MDIGLTPHVAEKLKHLFITYYISNNQIGCNKKQLYFCNKLILNKYDCLKLLTYYVLEK